METTQIASLIIAKNYDQLQPVILFCIEYFRIRVAKTCFNNMIGIARRIHNYLCITNSDYWKRGANPLLNLP